ncbi:mutS protein homolog 4 [Monosporozyma servazzii]
MEQSNLSSFIKANIFEYDSSKEGDTEPFQDDHYERGNSKLLIEHQPRISKQSQSLRSSQKKSKNWSSSRKLFLQTRQSQCLTTKNGPISRLITNTEFVVCSIFEIPNPLSTKVGSCVLNYDTGELILSEIIDSQIFIRTLNKIQVYEPTTIILPSTSITPRMSKLATILKGNISEGVKLKEVPNKKFSAENGIDILKEYNLNKEKLNSLTENLFERDFALAAAAAAIWFFKNNQDNKQYPRHVDFHYFRIRFEYPEDTMLIDSKTINGLELVENKNTKTGLSFFSFLNNTVTPMGKRLLRNSILQPLTKEENISLRLDVVLELVKRKKDLSRLVNELKAVDDLDSLFSKLLSFSNTNIEAEQKVNYILVLKKTIFTSQKLSEILKECDIQTTLLKEITHTLNNSTLLVILNLINKNINEDCVWANTNLEIQKQRSYAVKSGSNGLLKASREVYKSITHEILKEVKNLNGRYDFEIDYAYEARRGFYLKIKKTTDSDFDDLPPIFINRSSKKVCIECSTIELVKANVRLRDTLLQISSLSEQVLNDLFQEIKKENMSPLFMVAEAIALLDLLCCFAMNAIKYNYCKPTFSNMLHVKAGKHPVLDNYITSFIPNDILSIKDSSNFHIITGCNASGKSVYLKQIALLSIMAQIGCFVPAQSGIFPVFRNLHARVCNDTMEATTSNFAFEMKEMSYFLDNISEESLLIIDELGRGSSVNQGLAICLATLEYLLTIKNTVFVSTHFKDLPSLLKTKLQVVHLDMKAEVDDSKNLNMLYCLSNTATGIPNYGILMVQDILNEVIIENAYRIASLLLKSKVPKSQNHKCTPNVNVECLNEMKKVNNAVSVISSFLSTNKDVSSTSLKDIQIKIIENM